MKQVGPFSFPETQGESLRWTPAVRHRALSHRVLVVMRTRIECAWGAYIDAVPGNKHEDEVEEVLKTGVKLQEALARQIFTDIPKELPYAK